MRPAIRIGKGYDIHRLVPGRELVLGGERIDYDKGLLGHSDGDALLHAVADAILGAAAAGEIGALFPDDDPQTQGISSDAILRRAAQEVHARGYAVVNVDANVIAQEPRLAGYLDAMRRNIAETLGVDVDRVSVKARTAEGLGDVGAGEAIVAEAVALIEINKEG